MSPAGRPPLSEEDRKDEQVRIRLTSAEKAKLDAAAADEGKGTATWLRDLGLAAADQQAASKPTPKKATKKKG